MSLPVDSFATTVGASPLTLMLFMCVGFVLLGIALDYLNRHVRQRRRIEGEWRIVDQIARERGLTQEDIGLLYKVIHARFATEPLRSITIRQDFDDCVHGYCADLERGPAEIHEAIGIELRVIRERLGLNYVPFGQSIRSTREIYTGQIVNLSGRMDNKSSDLTGIVVEVDEASFRVQPKGATPDAFAPGEMVHFAMWREDDARYLFTAKYVRREKQPPLLVFRHTANLQRVQVREHFRIPFEAQTTIGVLDGSLEEGETRLSERQVITRLRGRFTSLSAGGFAALISQDVSKQAPLRVSIPLETSEDLHVEARIVAVTALPGGQYLVRAAYVGLSDQDRDAISRFVFRKQRPQVKGAANPE